MGTIEKEILGKVFERLEVSMQVTPEMRKALREILYQPGVPKTERLISALTVPAGPSPSGRDLAST